MHADMVGKISFRGMTEKRRYHPWKVMVEKSIFFPEKHPVAGAMKHQAKRSLEYKIIQVGISDCDCPP